MVARFIQDYDLNNLLKRARAHPVLNGNSIPTPRARTYSRTCNTNIHSRAGVLYSFGFAIETGCVTLLVSSPLYIYPLSSPAYTHTHTFDLDA